MQKKPSAGGGGCSRLLDVDELLQIEIHRNRVSGRVSGLLLRFVMFRSWKCRSNLYDSDFSNRKRAERAIFQTPTFPRTQRCHAGRAEVALDPDSHRPIEHQRNERYNRTS